MRRTTEIIMILVVRLFCVFKKLKPFAYALAELMLSYMEYFL